MAKILTVGNSVISSGGSPSGVSQDEFNQHVTDTIAHTTQDDKTKINETAKDLTTHTTNLANPHETKLSQLEDVEFTSLLDKQSLVYDATKGKYVNQFVSSTTDEKVKLESTSTNAKYLNEFLDDDTIVSENEKLIVKKIENMLATVDEINYLQGLDENIMTKLSKVVNGGLTIYKDKSFTDYAELLTFNFTQLSTGLSYLLYVVNDENHSNQCTAYLCDENTNNTTNLPIFFGTMNVVPRDFTTDQLDLASEVKGKLPQANMDLTGILKATDLSGYMKAEDYTGTGTNKVNISKTLDGLSHTVTELNDSIDNSHTHTNSVNLNKIGEDYNGNLTYDGKSTLPIATTSTLGGIKSDGVTTTIDSNGVLSIVGVFSVEYDSTNNTLKIKQNS